MSGVLYCKSDLVIWYCEPYFCLLIYFWYHVPSVSPDLIVLNFSLFISWRDVSASMPDNGEQIASPLFFCQIWSKFALVICAAYKTTRHQNLNINTRIHISKCCYRNICVVCVCIVSFCSLWFSYCYYFWILTVHLLWFLLLYLLTVSLPGV